MKPGILIAHTAASYFGCDAFIKLQDASDEMQAIINST